MSGLVEWSTRHVELTVAGQTLLALGYERQCTPSRTFANARVSDRPHGFPPGGARVPSVCPPRPCGSSSTGSCERNAGPEVKWQDVDNVEQFTALLENRADAVVCYGPVPTGIHTLPLGTEARFVARRTPIRWPTGETVTLSDPGHLPVIVSPHVDRGWRESGRRPATRRNARAVHPPHGNHPGIPAFLVGLGHGIRFISESCRALMPRPGVRYVAVTDLPPCTAVLRGQPPGGPPPPRIALSLLRGHARSGTAGRWWEAAQAVCSWHGA